MPTRLASTALLCGVAACGGSDLDPGAGNDLGSGTGTLRVDAIARASSTRSNARLRTDFETELVVHVSLGNQNVTAAAVTITSATGKTALTYLALGLWGAAVPGYDEVYVLDIVAGADRVDGVRVDGPDLHVFSQPAEGAMVDPTVAVALAWSCDDHADAATLHTDNRGAIAIPDTGSYSLAPGALRTERTQSRPNTLRLTRSNHATPKGAAADSSFTVSIDNEVDIIAEPQGMPL